MLHYVILAVLLSCLTLISILLLTFILLLVKSVYLETKFIQEIFAILKQEEGGISTSKQERDYLLQKSLQSKPALEVILKESALIFTVGFVCAIGMMLYLGTGKKGGIFHSRVN